MRRRRITRPRWDRRCARTRGGDGGARTRHLRSARPTLSQLSYVPRDGCPRSTCEIDVVTRAGLEPAPPGFRPGARTRYANESRRSTPKTTPTTHGVIGGIEPAPTRVTTERTDHRTTTEAATTIGRRGVTVRASRPAASREEVEPLRMSKPVADVGGRRAADAGLPSRRRARRPAGETTSTHALRRGGKVVEREGIEPLGFAPTTLRAVCRTSGARSSGEGPFVEPSPVEKLI